MISRRLFLTAGAAGPVFVSFGALAITDEAALAAERRIDVAGFQRTRVKRIAKAACYARAGVTPEKDFEMIAAETVAISETLLALRNGNRDLELARETHSKVLDKLREVKTLWLPFSERTAAIAERGSLTAAELDYVLEKEPALYEAMDAVVTEIQQVYGNKVLPLHLAVATNFAGRQRSLGQEVAKDVCLLGIGYKPEETREKLVQAMQLFENTHGALAGGMPMLGIRAPAQAALAAKYEEINRLWTELKLLAEPALAGDAVSAGEIAAVGAAADRLLTASDAAVKLYKDEV
ncbi:MAG: type IV pili methyl-accepting chemotaxis transducer N-terminal domain-containing protein [Pseudomonadota bacterium]